GGRTSRGPDRRPRKLTQMPKMKVSCSGTATASSRVNASRRASLSSFQDSPWWPSTTPFGCPVLPDVKTISAAPASSGLAGGGAAPIDDSLPARIANRLPSRPTRACVAAAGVATWIGAATQPASQIPRNPARSSGSFAMNRTIGSSGAQTPARSDAATSPAAAIISAALRICPPGAPVCDPNACRASSVLRPGFSLYLLFSSSARSSGETGIAPGQRRFEPLRARNVHKGELVRRSRPLDFEIDGECGLECIEQPLSLQRLVDRALGQLEQIGVDR